MSGVVEVDGSDFLRRTHNLKEFSSWFWRLLSKSADLSKPWGKFLQILDFSTHFCDLSFLLSWFWFYIDFLAENLQFRSVCCRYEYDVVLRGTNVIIYARLRLDRYAKWCSYVMCTAQVQVNNFQKARFVHYFIKKLNIFFWTAVL